MQVTANCGGQDDSLHVMAGAPINDAGATPGVPQDWRAAVENFLPASANSAEKIDAIEAALHSPLGNSMREAMARWIVDEIVPVERLVPPAYIKWRPPVRDSMTFVVARLSPARLAPKILEQIELPRNTPPEERLLRLIAKVPGLQKLGQVIARNQHLHPALRKALARLENGIRDVSAEDIRTIVQRELGEKVRKFAVEVSFDILKEASVSAVIRFTWFNPETQRREPGVFKVLKPHIPEYFAEDMDYLQGLAKYFGDRHHTYGFPAHLIPDTFQKVRRLLRQEVNFRREQKTLSEAGALYRSFRKIRVPRVIPLLCTRTVTAMTEERGIKVTNAAARLAPAQRRKLAEQMLEALIAVPLLSSVQDAVFHGDPHAGNLLFHRASGKLVILDWALRERLDREQRRHLAMLFLLVSLRDPVGVCHEVLALTTPAIKPASAQGRLVRRSVVEFLESILASQLPSATDAMRLLEDVAIHGVRFPGALIMLSKVMFTLEGILGEMLGSDTAIGFTIARQVAMRWLAHRKEFQSPLRKRDWFALQCSALLLPGRLGIQWQQSMLNRWLTIKPTPAAAK
jgi:ubiquinone biosynthesis protein